MKILIVFRKKKEESWDIVMSVKQKLEEKGHNVDLLSREDDLGIDSLSGSMGTLKEAIKRRDKEKNYDVIYTQDWSMAFPLLIPERVFEKKHFCFFHNVQEEGNSRIFQRIVGNMLGGNLLVRKEELKKKFPKSILAFDGINNIFK